MNHRNIPLGYAISGGNIIINEAEADTVREIAEHCSPFLIRLTSVAASFA